ncbi:hypothetical protein TNCV_1697741 [Trichonephila clavipes]|nr:hypothetical protein TNCV_1697741 [Trichonephila clavipes]
MQFGLLGNAAATFQRFIDEVLRNLPFVFAFVDDILVATTSYHPQANSLVERLHRVQRAPQWLMRISSGSETLPAVLLGLRVAVKHDINASGELVYGVSDYQPRYALTHLQCH